MDMETIPWVKCLAGCGLALLGMLVAFGLIRLAAKILIVLIFIGTVAVIFAQIIQGTWSSWLEICTGAPLLGAFSALISIPVLVLSRATKK